LPRHVNLILNGAEGRVRDLTMRLEWPERWWDMLAILSPAAAKS